MPVSYVMRVSRNGQVSIPAEIRARWQATHVVVVDLGDHIAIGPHSDDPVGALQGKYAGRGPSTDETRRAERRADAERERRRR